MRRRVSLWAICAALLGVALLGCGGGDGTSEGDPVAGREVFIEAGCGDCHTFAEAGTRGQGGPDLDDATADVEAVQTQVRSGRGLMPSFAGKLTEQEIQDVAQFVGGPNEGRSDAVVEEFQPDDTTLAQCGSGDFPCYEQAFGNLAYEQGTRAAVAELQEAQRTDRGLEANCHRIAHAMGAGSLLRSGDKVGPAMSEADPICWSGIYHGIVERAFSDTEDEQLAAKSRAMCADAETRADPFAYYQCVHGLGHGLMIQTGYELPRSLETCDALQTDYDRSSCTGGVFMENISSSYGVESEYLKKDDLVYPCNDVAERHKYYCYLMVTSRILQETGYDWERAAGECRGVEEDWIATCFQSFGRDASGQSQRDHAQIIERCKLAGAMEEECIYGVVRDITSNDASAKRASKFCGQVARRLRGRCYDGMGTILASLEPDGLRSACERHAGTYAADCLRGAGVQAG